MLDLVQSKTRAQELRVELGLRKRKKALNARKNQVEGEVMAKETSSFDEFLFSGRQSTLLPRGAMQPRSGQSSYALQSSGITERTQVNEVGFVSPSGSFLKNTRLVTGMAAKTLR